MQCNSYLSENVLLTFTYTLKDEILDTSDTANYLGITVANELSWTDHIAKITSKANPSLGFLKRNIKINSEKVKTKAYNTIVGLRKN